MGPVEHGHRGSWITAVVAVIVLVVGRRLSWTTAHLDGWVPVEPAGGRGGHAEHDVCARLVMREYASAPAV